MATDDERRRVAAMLRMSDERDAAGFVDCLLAEVVRGREFCETPCEHCHGRLLGELADLIEPGEPKVRCVAEVKVYGERIEKLVHDAAVELTGIDREALLALADELDGEGLAGWASGPVNVGSFARRIREACGHRIVGKGEPTWL